MLEQALAKIASTRQISPRVRATLLDKIGSIYSGMGNVDRAGPLLEEALEIRRKVHGEDSPEVACTWHNLGLLNLAAMSKAPAERAYRRALDIRERHLVPGHPDVTVTLTHLSVVKAMHDEWKESAELLRRARANHLKAGTTEGRDYGLVVVLLTGLLFSNGAAAEATLLLRQASEAMRAQGNKGLARCLHILWEVCHRQGKFREGFPFLRESVALRERDDGPLWYSNAGASLADEWVRFGDRDEAVKQLRAVVRRLNAQKALTADEARSLAWRCARLYELLAGGQEADEVAATAAAAVRSHAAASGKPARQLILEPRMASLREHPAMRDLLGAE